MTAELAQLRSENLKLRNRVSELGSALEKSKQRVGELEGQLVWLKRQLFGSKSEKLSVEDLSNMLPNWEEPAATIAHEERTITVERKVRKAVSLGGGRDELPGHLEVVEVELEAPAEVLENPGDWEKIGEALTVKLDIEPGRFVKKIYRRPKFKHVGEKNVLVETAAPKSIIDKGLADTGLIVEIVLNKYELHLPLERQSKMFRERCGVKLGANLMCAWMRAVGDGLNLVWDGMKTEVLSGGYIQADETPVRYQDPGRSGRCGTGFFWQYSAPGDNVLFEWKTSRGRDGPRDFLSGFKGYLQSDQYGVYMSLGGERADWTLLGCWAHARRKFFEAQDDDKEGALWFLDRIGKLYLIEKELREAGAKPGERKARRQRDAVPVLDEIHAELKQRHLKAMPQMKMGKAISYALKDWQRLNVYVSNGILEIDNNLAENAIRPTAVGKKNWLFIGSPDAGRQSAIIYSILGTCRRLGINTREYLTDVLTKIPAITSSQAPALTPKEWLKAKTAAQTPQPAAA